MCFLSCYDLFCVNKMVQHTIFTFVTVMMIEFMLILYNYSPSSVNKKLEIFSKYTVKLDTFSRYSGENENT